jgi:molybdopterin biosynthesis enzyme
MEETVTVAQMYERLMELAMPLTPLDLPLLDAHGATMASDLLIDQQVAIKSGSKINSAHIALAASLGLDRLPCRPHPRAVIISAGDDLVEPGSKLPDAEDEFESNSWFLTTFMKETGAHAFRVHTIPETSEELKLIVEDQLVRADLIVISGESRDESFELINSVVSQLGEIKTIIPNLAGSGKHNYGLIGPDKTPVVTLPGDPIGNFLSAEIFIKPMILKMLAINEINRTTKKVKLSKEINLEADKANYLRGKLNDDGQVEPLANQELIETLSKANCLITLGEKDKNLKVGDLVNIIMINQG